MLKRKLHLHQVALWLILTIGVLSIAVFFTIYPTYKMTDEDRIEGVRLIVAWIAEHKPLPGIEEEYPDWLIVEEMDVVVICDFLPSDLAVSQNPRIRRVSAIEYNTHLNDKYGSADYVKIKLKEDSSGKKVYEVSNIFGPQGGHGYHIEMRKKIYGLRAEVHFLWIM